MILVRLRGESVTPMEAAKALNVTGGPHVRIHGERENGPEVKVYPKFRGSKGILKSPWMSCPTFTADTVQQIREAEHVLGTAADLIALAGLLDAEQADDPTDSSTK